MILIAGPREISQKRFLELVKHYIKKDDLTFGFLREEFVEGFEGQPHFRAAKLSSFEKLIAKIQERLQSSLPSSGQAVYSLRFKEYKQKDFLKVVEEIKPERIILINGSWNRAFHRKEEYKALMEKKIEVSFKSAFVSEDEARDYFDKIKPKIEECVNALMRQSSFASNYAKASMDKNASADRCGNEIDNEKSDLFYLEYANIVAKRSFDYTRQIGAVIVKDGKIIAEGHNTILPFETIALHEGMKVEKDLAPLNDLNTHDTLHAEMNALATCLRENIDLRGATLYVDLMPCPACARMIAKSGIKRVVCKGSHFGGWAEKLFDTMGL